MFPNSSDSSTISLHATSTNTSCFTETVEEAAAERAAAERAAAVVVRVMEGVVEEAEGSCLWTGFLRISQSSWLG